ncbi:alpha/beta hydrolase family protein [Nocardia sp. alder85J]|uniref:alpha/beta hydrolase family protein n=1 Tax=Nocardia sp. alder85J TaxID=2862949 RepID=UPI001CD726AC|nr:alpha/beta hydrolase [Nocardia sp. alder85J]MCX4096967.1 alpha/beta hydrolase [Nocardia sp. alder85J]
MSTITASVSAALGVGASIVAGGAPDAAADGANTIESSYSAAGPYATTTSTVVDEQGRGFTIVRPADYSALGFPSPILSWGNGTASTPREYTRLLGQLASYGFTVVASELSNTGSGVEIDAGTDYLVAQNAAGAGELSGRLDTARIGVFGHSQGAAGAVNAALHDPDRYAAVLTFSLPDQAWSRPNSDCPTAAACSTHPDQLRAPIFLIGTRGAFDAAIASPRTETAYYDSVPGHAALGIVAKDTDHAMPTDKSRPDADLGYTTAWFLAELRGDQRATAAFTGDDAELVHNTDWSGSAVK